MGAPLRRAFCPNSFLERAQDQTKTSDPPVWWWCCTHTPTAQKSDNSSSWKIEKQFCSSCSLFILNLSGMRVGVVVVVGWTEIHPSARQMKTVCFSDFHSARNLIGKSNDDSLTHSNRFPFLNSILLQRPIINWSVSLNYRRTKGIYTHITQIEKQKWLQQHFSSNKYSFGGCFAIRIRSDVRTASTEKIYRGGGRTCHHHPTS